MKRQRPNIQVTLSKVDAEGNKVPFDPTVDKRIVNEVAAANQTIKTGTVYVVKGA